MKVIYNESTLALPEGTSIEAARDALKPFHPEVANATAEEVDEDTIRFVVQSGQKGADEIRVIYGETDLMLPGDTTVEEAREALASIHPEIRNAEAVEEDGVIRFVVKSGQKGDE